MRSASFCHWRDRDEEGEVYRFVFVLAKKLTKMDGFGELMQLLENDIPECRRRLKESHANLEKVASYCEGNYLQVSQLY